MTEWTAGKVVFAGLGAAGAALLVGKAIHTALKAREESLVLGPAMPPSRPPMPPEPPRNAQEIDWSAQPTAPAHQFPPLVERWRGAVAVRATDMPHLVDAILHWIEIESGGDTCSTGIPGREAGIFQLDFPGDAKYGATFAGLMAICKRSQGRKDPTDLSWMTPAELEMEVGSGVRKFKAAVDAVRTVFAANGVTWPENTSDFGAAVKQIHAAPAVLGELLPKIAKRDGPPDNWHDFHAKVMAIPADQMSGVKDGKPYGLRLLALSPSKHDLKNRLEDTLRNAEEFAAGWPTG